MDKEWRGKVLIVDDNEDNVDLAEQILEDDYDICTAESGEACIEVAVKESPDVIILDVQMPGMDGYETLEKMQTMDECKDIPVIFLSARYRDVDRVIHGLELGALDYITKPVDDDLLQAKVRVAMRIKRAEDLVRKQRQDLFVANQDLKGFAYSASHDLRAPLRHINNYIDALNEDYGKDLPEDAQFMMQRIASSSAQMNNLIEDLLSFSRATAAEVVKSKVNMTELAQKELAKLQKEEPDREVEVHVQEGLNVEADANMMAIVMHNLLGNAWKYTKKTKQATIEIGFEKDSQKCVYFVKDNGAGFDMAYEDKLFKPFSRLHTEEDFEGNGIGLATVQRIIEKHGGSIKAEAGVEKGAVFFFSLGEKV